MPLPVQDTEPLKRQLLRDVVYNRLYEGIIDGTLEPGETLLDDKLTAWLGVSRTPIREALMKLADIDLVEMAPNRYTRVAPIDLRAINEAIYTSSILHEYAAHDGIPHITAEGITQLNAIVKKAKKQAKDKDLTGLGTSLTDFFAEISRATGNAILVTVLEGLGPQFLRYINLEQLPFEPGNIPEKLADIAAAAKAKDAEGAKQLVSDFYTPLRQQFLTTHRRSDAEIDKVPVL